YVCGETGVGARKHFPPLHLKFPFSHNFPGPSPSSPSSATRICFCFLLLSIRSLPGRSVPVRSFRNNAHSNDRIFSFPYREASENRKIERPHKSTNRKPH